MPYHGIIAGLLAAFSLSAAYMDIRYRKVPNWMTLPVLGAGLLLGILQHGIWGAESSAEGIAAAALVFFALAMLTGMPGMGDVKALAAAGALLGSWPLGLEAFVFGTLFGGPLALAVLAANSWSGRKNERHQTIPYMPALSLGMLVTAAQLTWPQASIPIMLYAAAAFLLTSIAAALAIVAGAGYTRHRQKKQTGEAVV